MKKVAVIGANSYIARNFIKVYEEIHPDCIFSLFDRDEKHADNRPEYKQLNLLDRAMTDELDLDVDAVVLFTGKTGTVNGFDDYETFINVNEIGLLNLLDSMRKSKSRAKLIFPSTRLVYKGSAEPLSEDAPKEAKTIYAANKLSCENYLKMYSSMFNINYCIFRICVPYGTLMEGASSYGTAEFFIGKAKNGDDISLYGDGKLRRTFTYIGDICKILARGCDDERLLNDVYNIGGEDLQLKDMAEYIAGIYNVGISYVPWPENALLLESGSTVFDSSKLDSLIGNRYDMTMKEWIGGKR